MKTIACLTMLFGLPILVPDEKARASHLTDTNRIYATQSRASSPAPNNFQLFLNLKTDATIASAVTLFSLGGVYGLDFLGTTLYGTEFVSAANYYLVTIPHEGGTEGFGARVSASTIGFPNVEGLAVADGVIYASSLNYAAHQTRLITINPATGVGASIGLMATDIMIVGLAYDQFNQVLYGAGTPFAGTPANLYRINRTTAEATLVGPLGKKIEGLSWDVSLGLIGSFTNLYQINTQTGAATQIGTEDFTGGTGPVNGIYALAAYVPTNVLSLTFRNISIAGGNVTLTWNSVAGVTYRVESRAGLTSGIWTNLSPNVAATGTNASYIHTGGGTANTALYRVKIVAP